MAIEVREAQLPDAAAISMLMGELGYPTEESQTLAKLADLAGRSTDKVFVATRAGEVIGAAGVHIMPLLHKIGNAARITVLVVTALARRQQVGAALVQAVEDFAWAQDCGQIEVTSGDGRFGAHRFYEQAGYCAQSRRFIKVRVSNQG